MKNDENAKTNIESNHIDIFLTFIIPFYNSGKFLHRSVKSAKNQIFKNIEIMLINDGSTDDSLKIARKIAQNDEQIRIFSNIQNMGLHATRFLFLNEARGKYICYLDSDDFVSENLAQIIYNVDANIQNKISQKLEKNIYDSDMDSKNTQFLQNFKNNNNESDENIDVIFFKMAFFPKSIKNIFRTSVPILDDEIKNDEILKAVFDKQTPPLHMHTKVYNAQFLRYVLEKNKHIMLQYLNMGEDLFANFIIMSHAKNIKNINQKLYFYCDNPTSITSQFESNKVKSRINELQDIISRLNKVKNDNKYLCQTRAKVINIIKSVIELQKRYDDGENGAWQGFCTYIKYVSKSLKYHVKFKNILRIIIVCASFGRIKI